MKSLEDILAFYGIGPTEKTSSARCQRLRELKKLQPLYQELQKTSALDERTFLERHDAGDLDAFEDLFSEVGPRSVYEKVSSNLDALHTLCAAEEAGRELAVQSMKAVFEHR